VLYTKKIEKQQGWHFLKQQLFLAIFQTEKEKIIPYLENGNFKNGNFDTALISKISRLVSSKTISNLSSKTLLGTM